MDKNYIGREEAYELLLKMPSFERLPRVGREYCMVYSTCEKACTGKKDYVMGKDEAGYYVRDLE